MVVEEFVYDLVHIFFYFSMINFRFETHFDGFLKNDGENPKMLGSNSLVTGSRLVHYTLVSTKILFDR